MRQLGESVYFADISRPRRGYYVCRFVKMADNASKTVEKVTTDQWPLTDRYFQISTELSDSFAFGGSMIVDFTIVL